MAKKDVKHIDKNTAIVSFKTMGVCNRMDAKHYTSGEHERECLKEKARGWVMDHYGELSKAFPEIIEKYKQKIK
jgi:hypothetical protein